MAFVINKYTCTNRVFQKISWFCTTGIRAEDYTKVGNRIHQQKTENTSLMKLPMKVNKKK
jgi:hypothetical protein